MFHSGRDLKFFPDLIEYIRIIKEQHGYQAFYIGYSETKSGKYFLKELGVPAYYIDPKKNLKERLSFLRSYVGEVMPDILHVFHYRGSGFIPLSLMGKSVKCILDVRTVVVEDKMGKPNLGLTLYLKDKLTWLESLSFHQSLALTTTIKKKLMPARREVQLIPLGANKEKFIPCSEVSNKLQARQKLALPQEDIVFLYSGSLSPARKMEVATEAICKLVKEMDTITFLVVGNSSFKWYNGKLKQISKNYKVSNKIRFVGKVPYEEIPVYYAASDIGISFTPVDTGYATQPPTKVLEYLMAGMLVVSNRTPAVEGLVTEGRTGFLSNDTVEDFSQALKSAIRSYKKEANLADRAVKSVLKFDWSELVKKRLLPLYKDISKEDT